VAILVLQYAENETEDIQEQEYLIDFHTPIKPDDKISVFRPTTEAGWNVAFGFVGKDNMTEDIGKWEVRHTTRRFNTETHISERILSNEYYPVRPCKSNEFNLTKENSVGILTDLSCSDVFEMPL